LGRLSKFPVFQYSVQADRIAEEIRILSGPLGIERKIRSRRMCRLVQADRQPINMRRCHKAVTLYQSVAELRAGAL
jgi:hypothetical protein